YVANMRRNRHDRRLVYQNRAFVGMYAIRRDLRTTYPKRVAPFPNRVSSSGAGPQALTLTARRASRRPDTQRQDRPSPGMPTRPQRRNFGTEARGPGSPRPPETRSRERPGRSRTRPLPPPRFLPRGRLGRRRTRPLPRSLPRDRSWRLQMMPAGYGLA